MDVRVEAGILTAGAVITEITVNVVSHTDVKIPASIITRFSLAPVLSIGGTSISSITPTNFLIGAMAAS